MKYGSFLTDSTIDEFFYGHTSPAETGVYQDPKILIMTQKMHRLNKELDATLTTDEQKAICAKLEDIFCDLQVLRESEVFRCAFKLGARTALEMVTDER